MSLLGGGIALRRSLSVTPRWWHRSLHFVSDIAPLDPNFVAVVPPKASGFCCRCRSSASDCRVQPSELMSVRTGRLPAKLGFWRKKLLLRLFLAKQ